jgi:hypothetical protein
MDPDSRLKIKPKIIDNNGSVNMLVPRYAPLTKLAPAPSLINDGKSNIHANDPAEVNTYRSESLMHLKPNWG